MGRGDFGIRTCSQGLKSSLWETHCSATDMPYGIRQCYLPPTCHLVNGSQAARTMTEWWNAKLTLVSVKYNEMIYRCANNRPPTQVARSQTCNLCIMISVGIFEGLPFTGAAKDDGWTMTKTHLLNAKLTPLLNHCNLTQFLTLSLTVVAFRNGSPSEWQANFLWYKSSSLTVILLSHCQQFDVLICCYCLDSFPWSAHVLCHGSRAFRQPTQVWAQL